MPSSTPKQAKLMSAIAHGWHMPGGGGPPLSVAKEFHAADAGKKWGGKHKNTAGPKVAAHYKAQYHRNKQGGGATPPRPMLPMMSGSSGQPQALQLRPPQPPSAQPQPPQGSGAQPSNPFQPSYQLGGDVVGMHKRPGQTAMESMYRGPIKSTVPGRTDKLRLDVKPGSYIMPADIVSGIGQGNTDAGHAMLKALFTPSGLSGTKMGHKGGAPKFKAPGMGAPQMPKHIGPMGRNVLTGIGHPRSGMGMRPSRMSASGGSEWDFDPRHDLAHGGQPTGRQSGVPIVAAGGEHVITPEEIIWKFGSLNRGHNMLDHIVKHLRKKHIKQQAELPPPKKKYGGRIS